MLAVAVLGTFFVTRSIATRAAASLDQELARRSLEWHATMRDRELSLLESVTLATNMEGMATSVTRRDSGRVEQLAQSVLALKRDLDFVVVTDATNRLVAQVGGTAPPLAAPEVAYPDKRADLVTGRDGTAFLTISAVICADGSACEPAGYATVGLPLVDAIDDANVTPSGELATVAVYAADGALVGSSGSIAPLPEAPKIDDGRSMRRSHRVEGEDVATLFTPLTFQGRRVGSMGVSASASAAQASAREAAVRLWLIVLAGMVGVVAVGVVISRFVLGQIRPLVEASRRLGSGDFSVRVPVTSDDELGELARGVNQMADQLRASYETLESRVEQRTAEVHRLLRERTEFFASISHELRTPLAVIIAQAELLADESHSSRRSVMDGSATITSAASQLLGLVNDILDLARAEAGRLRIVLVHADLVGLVEELLPTLRGLAGAASLDLVVELDGPLPVRADPTRIRAVLLNLVDNAAKYTPPGGRITVAARRRDGTAELTVTDTGIGVPPDIGDRIFEPFFLVPSNETQGGQPSTGLGLALTRRLVEAHEGQLSYSSDGVSGTTLRIILPLAPKLSRRSRATAHGAATR